ncbi:uncharacterized protein MELLADRAFT_124523 [Melampsora larici-populina 98AG31]|uniref:Secreted protein n=1 Tax=Melampsora larici-populina (strain 98AG31 / pathotype 3-4-7) TaxID=747676 RepID=F4RIB9_MELLP|nr:uncharacterized protein MELLADRAFT_124523 [Melampsora larici-populina 98AG31]EGG07991.1 secreted protein [Melampsora larici-populina 98AG31]
MNLRFITAMSVIGASLNQTFGTVINTLKSKEVVQPGQAPLANHVDMTECSNCDKCKSAYNHCLECIPLGKHGSSK